VTSTTQGHKISLRRLEPSSDRAGRVASSSRSRLAALRSVALGLVVLVCVLLWLVVVPLVELVRASLAGLGRLLRVPDEG
jgi:hypothetical protein